VSNSTAGDGGLPDPVDRWLIRLLEWWAAAKRLAKSGRESVMGGFWWICMIPSRIAGWTVSVKRRIEAWRAARKEKSLSAEALSKEMQGDPSPETPSPDETIQKTLDAVAEKMVEQSPIGVAGPQASGAQAATTERVQAAQAAATAAAEQLPRADGWPVADAPETVRDSVEGVKDAASGFPSKDEEGRSMSFGRQEAHAADARTEDEIIPLPRRSEVKKTDTNVRGYWENNPNAEERIQEALRTPIVDRHVRTIVEHLITSRPQIKGPEKQADALRRWFEVEVEINSGHERGINRFVSDVAGQMLRYGSAAVFKQRTRSDVGDTYDDPLTGGTRQPLSSYIVPDMSTVQVFFDERGRPRKWRQDPHLHQGHDPPKYSDRDVFLARLPSRNSSMYFWTPSLVTIALYPIEVLRDLHETIEQHTKNIIDIPNYAKVGDKNYLDGQVNEEMLRRIQRVIEQTPRGAMPVLPWFVEIAEQESDEYVEQLTEAAEFWEKETRRGVGGSKLQDGVGDSGTRNTSEVLISKEMRTAQSLVPEIRRVFRWMAVDKLVEKGVVEMGEVTGHDDIASLVFPDIDMHKQIKREEHYIHAWQNSAYRHEEFRRLMNRDPDPEHADKYFFDIQKAVESAGTKAKTESRTRPGGSPRPKNPNDSAHNDGAHNDGAQTPDS
jgi:hypothetical protein